MRHYRWEGSATALSSVAHGGQTLGTVTYLRRERFLGPDGLTQEIPVVSGNGVRALLRDIGAELLWARLGSPRLPLPVVHALWSGGALVKSKGQPLTGARLATLRRQVAHVGVFGAAGGGRLIDGALQVGKMLPVCAQTAHLLPPELAAGPLPEMWDLVQVEEYTRLPNADRLPEVTTTSTPGSATDGAGEEPPDLGAAADGLIRYGVETLIAGTRFHTWFALHNATADEHDFFAAVLARYTANPLVGGRSARGHGRLRLSLSQRCLDGQPEPGDWTALGGADVEEVIDTLRWLA